MKVFDERLEQQWEHVRDACRLGRKGEIMIVSSSSSRVRDEVRSRLLLLTRVCVTPAGPDVVEGVQRCAEAQKPGDPVPVAWIEALGSEDAWLKALVQLNGQRDNLRERGPCHVVLAGSLTMRRLIRTRAPDLSSFVSVEFCDVML